MRNIREHRTGRRAAMGGLLGIVLMLAGDAMAIAAEDDDDATFEERIIKNS